MINGIFNIYKEKGYTSNDVVCRLRGILHQRKIGHTGTLDPDAEGVLPVCAGSATKLCELLTDHDKEYEAVMRLGLVTDTQDLSGQVLRQEVPSVSEQAVRDAILSFTGSYEQIPPMYSALKVNGKKLYEYARSGITVERKARTVMIHEIDILEVASPEVTFRVRCSKGTYIRTLCHDIGQKLGCGAAMASLVRTRVGRFGIQDALTLGQIEGLRDSGQLDDAVLPVDAPLMHLTAAVPKDEQTLKALRNGNALRPERLKFENKTGSCPQQLRIYDQNGHFMAIYTYASGRGQYMPEKMFLTDFSER